jgi:hypothetical protein
MPIMHRPGLGRALSQLPSHAGSTEQQGNQEPSMDSSVAARISSLLQQILAQSGWLRLELCRLQRNGLGDRRMRELCDHLDALDSSIHWDLRDELRRLSGRSPARAGRILAWLNADIDPLLRLVRRLDAECPAAALVPVAKAACDSIIECLRDIECSLWPTVTAGRLQSCPDFARVGGWRTTGSKLSSSPGAC